MKKKKIAPDNFQGINELGTFAFEDFGESSYSWFILDGDLQEFQANQFEFFSDEELKAMTLAIEEQKARS